MTTAIFWRFLWKEYRVMRAFWISMAVLAVLAQLSLVAFPGLTQHAAAWTFSFALIFPALYAVACGATMFAAEKEEGTYEFLRSLPVTAWRLLTGKLAFAVASTVLLIGALWMSAACISEISSVDAIERWQLWATFGVAAVEGLAWGVLFSLLLRRALQAAVFGIAATSLAVHALLWAVAPVAGEGHVYELNRYLAAVPYRIAVVAAVLVVDGLLVRKWLATRGSIAPKLFRRRQRCAHGASDDCRCAAALTGANPDIRPTHLANVATIALDDGSDRRPGYHRRIHDICHYRRTESHAAAQRHSRSGSGLYRRGSVNWRRGVCR